MLEDLVFGFIDVFGMYIRQMAIQVVSVTFF